MPFFVPEPPIVRCGLVTAELGPNGSVDQLGQVVRDFGIRAKTKEYVSGLTGLVFLAPDLAVAEIRNCAYAVVERNSLLAVGLILAPLARCFADFDVGQRQVVAVEQLGNLGGADNASSSVQPLSMVLARNAWMRVLSLSSAARLGFSPTDALPQSPTILRLVSTLANDSTLPSWERSSTQTQDQTTRGRPQKDVGQRFSFGRHSASSRIIVEPLPRGARRARSTG